MMMSILKYIVLLFMGSVTSFCTSDDHLQEYKIPKQKSPLIGNILTSEEEKLEVILDEIWYIKQIDMFGIQKRSSFQNFLEKKKLDMKIFFQNNYQAIDEDYFNRIKKILGDEFAKGLNITIIEEEK